MEALAIIGTFGSIVTFIFFFFTTRHKERMALIESGKDASIFNRTQLGAHSALKFGILLLSAGLGVLLGLFLSESFNIDEAVILPSVMICGGLGLVTYYKIINDKLEREN